MKKAQVIVYVRVGSKSEVIKLDNLYEGHKKFNELKNEGNFDYLELGIDKIDINGTYPIIRSISN